MKTLFENVFRKQLRRIVHDTGSIPNVYIDFGFTDTDFVYEVRIMAHGKCVHRVIDHITEDSVKEMVDCLISECSERTVTIDTGRTINIRGLYTEPCVTHWNGEIRDSGVTLAEQPQEVCHG